MASRHRSYNRLARTNQRLRLRLAAAEQALATLSTAKAEYESEGNLQALFDLIPIGISILNTERKIVFVNPALEQILDIRHAELVAGGYRTRRYLRSDGTPMPIEEFASMRAIKEQRAVYAVETGIVKEDGQVVWVNVSAVPVPFHDWSVIVVTADITKRKQAEEALRANQQNLESLIENTDGSIWSVDTAYQLIVGNRLYHDNVRAALGRPQIQGESVLAPELPQAALAEWRIYYDRAIQSGTFSIEAATRFTQEPHILEYRFSPIKNTFADVVGVTVFGRDITERKQAEAALHRTLAKLAASNADLDRQTHELQASELRLRALLAEKEVLLKEIHHRVKNNLQVVMSLLRLQSRQIADVQAMSALRDSRQRVEVMALVHELLYRTNNVARINAEHYFRQLGSQLIRIYEMKPGQITVTVTATGLSLSLDQAVPCGLIISELLSTSLKYAFPGGQRGVIGITLHATSPDTLTLKVWDTGVGLAPNAELARSSSLGMTLVQDLVRQLHGTAVTTNEGGISTTITFPLATTDA